MINEEPLIAVWDDTRWLVMSSCFFIFPSIYSYYKQLYLYSILLYLTSFISANYWRKATYSWRRNIDLIFAKISFTIFVINGIMYVRYIPYIITGYSGLIVLVYCYYCSGTLFKMNNENWWKYHVLFHLIMTFEQMIIIDSMHSLHF
jgi:hypothetical protein